MKTESGRARWSHRVGPGQTPMELYPPLREDEDLAPPWKGICGTGLSDSLVTSVPNTAWVGDLPDEGECHDPLACRSDRPGPTPMDVESETPPRDAGAFYGNSSNDQMAGRRVGQRCVRPLRCRSLIPGSRDRAPSHFSTGRSRLEIGFLAHARRQAHFGPWFGDICVIVCLFLLLVGCDECLRGEESSRPALIPRRLTIGSEDRPLSLDHIRDFGV